MITQLVKALLKALSPFTTTKSYIQTFDSEPSRRNQLNTRQTSFSPESRGKKEKRTKEYLAGRREDPRGRSSKQRFCFRDCTRGPLRFRPCQRAKKNGTKRRNMVRKRERKGGGRGRWLSGARQNGAKLCRSREAYLGRSRLYAETWWHRYRRLNVRR